MSATLEDNQVDFVPDDPQTGDDEQPNVLSCKNCFRSDVCYAYFRVKNLDVEMKQLKFVELPFEPEILATKCEMYLPKKNVRIVDMKKEQTETKEG